MKRLTKLLVMALLVVCTLFAVACTPKNLGDSVEKLIEDGYGVIVMKNDCNYIPVDSFYDSDIEGDFSSIVATKETSYATRGIFILIFEKKRDAKSVFKEMEDELEDLSKEESIIYERKGKMIIIADESAYEDFTE